nr:MAG TPA: hypothetical protein [Caudoviricetes sp.]
MLHLGMTHSHQVLEVAYCEHDSLGHQKILSYL